MTWLLPNNPQPKEGQVVFVLLKNKFPDVLKYSDNLFCTLDGLEEKDVTHWLPIPEFHA